MRNISPKLLIALLICLTHGKTLAQEHDKANFSERSFMLKVDPIHPFFRGIGGKLYFSLSQSNVSVFGGGGMILSPTNSSGVFASVDGMLYFIPLNFIVASSADYFYEFQGEMRPSTTGLYLEGGITIGTIDKFASKRAVPELFVRFVRGNGGEIYDLYSGFGHVATSYTSLIEGGARFSLPLLRINTKDQYIAGLDCNFGGAIGTLIWERYYRDTNVRVKDYIFVFDVILNLNLFIAL